MGTIQVTADVVALESGTITHRIISPYLLYSPIAHPCWSGIFPGLFSLWRHAPVWGCRGPPAPQLWPRCLESQTQHSHDKVDGSGGEGLAARAHSWNTTRELSITPRHYGIRLTFLLLCLRYSLPCACASWYIRHTRWWRKLCFESSILFWWAAFSSIHYKSGHAGEGGVVHTEELRHTAYCLPTVGSR